MQGIGNSAFDKDIFLGISGLNCSLKALKNLQYKAEKVHRDLLTPFPCLLRRK